MNKKHERELTVAKFEDIDRFPHCNYKIDVALDFLLDHIKFWEEDFVLELNPDFQRGHVWEYSQQVKYIEYILMKPQKGPSTSLIFNCTNWDCYSNIPEENIIQCVDGLQRITALTGFLKNNIPAYGRLLNDYEDQRYLKSVYVQFYVNSLPTRADVLKYYIQLNSGGTVHTSEEIERVKKTTEKGD